MKNNTFQRIGAISNSHVGRKFELSTQSFFASQKIDLKLNHKILIGIGLTKKEHAFDLGNINKKIIVECKSHRWTSGDLVPSAKMTVWNEAMYYFMLAPKEYKKIMFILKDLSKKRKETLAEYYIRTYRHLIPNDVEFWEYDEKINNAKKLTLDH